METIHGSAFLWERQLPEVFDCINFYCNPYCVHCHCARTARTAHAKVLAGENSTKDYWFCWTENAKVNVVEEPEVPGRVIKYQDCFGVDAGVELIKRVNDEGYSCLGTREARNQALKASLRESRRNHCGPICYIRRRSARGIPKNDPSLPPKQAAQSQTRWTRS